MNLIGEYHFHLSPRDTFSNKSFEFFVPENAQKLRIDWQYSPKRLTDPAACARIAEETLRRYLPDEYERQVLFDYHVGTMGSLGNQLNYTLFAAGDFRGSQIRERTAELADGLAPPGFLPGVPRGACKIILSVFCVYTENCQVDFQIEYE